VFAGLTRDLLAQNPKADGVFLGARIDLQTLALGLEAELGLPVVHSTAASVWWVCRELGAAAARGGGRLLAGR
jgi:maleate cis-trans isomerase